MKLLHILTILTILICTNIFAENGFNVDFSQPEEGIYELNFSVNEYQLSEVSKKNKEFMQIDFQNSTKTNKKGFAELPFLNSTIQIDNYNAVDLEIIEVQFEEVLLNYPLLPSRGEILRSQNPSEIPYIIAEKSLTDSWYPEIVAKKTNPFILRDVRGVSVYVYPFQYNANSNVLRIYSQITVRIVEKNEAGFNVLNKKETSIVREMDPIYKSVFINYSQNRDLHIGENGEILVIYTERDQEAIQPFIEWKIMKGFSVQEEIVSTGVNVANLIQEKYNENTNLLYVQLVGDWEDIKSNTNGVVSGAPMDPMLGCVVGTDYFPDLAIGRFSAQNPEQVIVQVNKVINYEKNEDINGEWYFKGLGIGSNDSQTGDDGETDPEHIDVIKENKLLPFTYDEVAEAYYTPSINMVKDPIEIGLSLINYCGHGSKTTWVTSGFNNNTINTLSNGIMLPVIISVACDNGIFHTPGDCFAEAWLKKEGGGAIATLMATISQPWTPPQRGQDYFNDLLIGGYNYSSNPGNGINTNEGRTMLGSLIVNAFALMYTESNSSSDLKTIQTWTTFGDPSLQLRTTTPMELFVSNTNVISNVNFETTITNGAGNGVSALVSISQNGENFVGYSDENGQVIISHDLVPGVANLVISGFNLETKCYDVIVPPAEGPYLVINSCSVNDDNNNLPEFAETMNFSFEIENIGTEASNQITAILSSESEYISEISDNEEFISIIDSGQVFIAEDAFEFSISNNVPDQEAILFEINMTDNTQNTYQKYYTIFVNSPNLIFDDGGLVYVLISAGDNIDLDFALNNEGHAVAKNIVMSIEEINGIDVEISNDLQNLGNIAPEEVIPFSIGLSFGDLIENGDIALFNVNFVGDDGLEVSCQYELIIVVEETEITNQTSLLTDQLIGNYPNPFNPITEIQYSVGGNSKYVNLEIYNIKGEKINTLFDNMQQSGNHTIIWNGKDYQNNEVGNGVYFYKITIGDFQKINKMILLK